MIKQLMDQLNKVETLSESFKLEISLSLHNCIQRHKKEREEEKKIVNPSRKIKS